MIEIPPKFAGKPPVNPETRKDKSLFPREGKSAQPRRGCAPLRPVDARRGREAHRHAVSQDVCRAGLAMTSLGGHSLAHTRKRLPDGSQQHIDSAIG